MLINKAIERPWVLAAFRRGVGTPCEDSGPKPRLCVTHAHPIDLYTPIYDSAKEQYMALKLVELDGCGTQQGQVEHLKLHSEGCDTTPTC